MLINRFTKCDRKNSLTAESRSSTTLHTDGRSDDLHNFALLLAALTVVYNVAEGSVATWLGSEDETFTLFGFGLDSFVEVISGIGIIHMVLRIKKKPDSSRDQFEKVALRVTGTAFYMLVAELVLSALFIVYTGHRPVATFWGVVISLISIAGMILLIYWKINVGKKLNSKAILADANCSKVCLYMSLVLLASSVIYEITDLPYVDAAGTIGLAYFSFNEGKECFEKARNQHLCSCE